MSTAGMGGGLAVRALQAGTRLAKAVDRADTAYSTANGAYRTAKDIAEGDGQGALINGTLTALGAKHLGGSRPKPTRLESPTPALPNSAKTTQAEAKDLAEGAGVGKTSDRASCRVDGVIKRIDDVVMSGGKVKINKSGDPIITQGERRIRIDSNNPHGDKPHFHHERQTPSGRWKDAASKHRYYFKEDRK